MKVLEGDRRDILVFYICELKVEEDVFFIEVFEKSKKIFLVVEDRGFIGSYEDIFGNEDFGKSVVSTIILEY